MVARIHAQHARFMISVWGKFYPVTENYKALKAINGLYRTTITEHTLDWLNHEYAFYDVFNAPARKMFWDQVNRGPVQERRGRVVDGRDRTGCRAAVAAHARPTAPRHRSHRGRNGVAGS